MHRGHARGASHKREVRHALVTVRSNFPAAARPLHGRSVRNPEGETVMKRRVTLELVVEADATVGENDIENAINAALDEPPCDWGDWTVTAAVIVKVEKVKR